MIVTRKDEYGTNWEFEMVDTKTGLTATVERLTDPKTNRPVVFIATPQGSKMMMPSMKEGIDSANGRADEMFATICVRAGAK